MARSRRFAPTPLAALVPTSDDGAELISVVVALEQEGSRPPKTWSSCCEVGRRLIRWLSDRELELDEVRSLSERDAHGMPIVPTALLVAFVDEVLLGDGVKPDSAMVAMKRLIAWFTGKGWSTSHLKRSGAGLALLSALVRNHRHDDVDAYVRVPARPVVTEWISRIAEEIESTRDDESIRSLWVDAMVTYHVLTFYLAMRGRESATHLRWGWIDDQGDRLVVETPGGFVLKHQAAARTIIVPANPDSTGLCPVAQLRRWRQRCVEAEVPVCDDALVFPAVRKVLPEVSLTSNQPWWGDRLWVADPITDAATAAITEGCDPEEVKRRVESARRSQRSRYAREWRTFAVAAGFEARHRFEKVASHGMRRGAATTMRANGASSAAIAAHLRHGSGASTELYIDRSELSTPDPRPLYAIEGLRDVEAPDLQVVALLDPTATPQNHLGRCEVRHRGEACGRDFRCHIDVGEGPVPACEAHFVRARKGLRGDELTEPVNSHRLEPNCRVPHEGVDCGEDTAGGSHIEIDGVRLSACTVHARRHRSGATGDELTAPVHYRQLSGRCEVVHRGMACARDTKNGRRVTIDGHRVECCAAHRQRHQAGKRGDAFTQPIGSPALAGKCDVSHHGVACRRPAKNRIKLDGVLTECCPGHRTRWVNGKRGDDFTAPICGAVRSNPIAPESCNADEPEVESAAKLIQEVDESDLSRRSEVGLPVDVEPIWAATRQL